MVLNACTPKALCTKAQGCEALRATLGKLPPSSFSFVVDASPIDRARIDHKRIIFIRLVTQGSSQSLATLGFDI